MLLTIVLLFPATGHSQGRDRSKFHFFSDTTFTGGDTLGGRDTSIVKIPVDSTARIQNFKYVREDKPNTPFGKYIHPLLLSSTSGFEYRINFDTSGSVIISQTFQGEDVKVPLKISFEKYIEVRTKLGQRDLFYGLVADYYKIETQDELERLFKNITDITIPLPFSTETIFGPPTINLKINGAIDITASYQKSSSDQETFTNLNQQQDNINFKQEVQVTTKGSVGDKLTIDADWNSQRTFEYENQLKLKYTGYPDEVVQSLEAGNVSLETKSNLIGSTQALFGVKGQFKLGPLSLTAIATQKKSEKKEVNITGGSQEITFEIAATDYADNYYFLDTNYRTFYEQYYTTGNLLGTQDSGRITDIEVWVQTSSNNQNKRFAVGWIQLPPKPLEGYDPYYKNRTPAKDDSTKASGNFYKLQEGEYTLEDKAGYVAINVNLPNPGGDGIAVAYKTQNGRQYGMFSTDQPSDSLVLKLVRYPGLQSPYDFAGHKTAWNLKIKNIYPTGVRKIQNDPSKLTVNVYKKPPSGENEYSYADFNRTYLYLTGLDRRRNGATYDTIPGGDGAFDFFSGYTVNRASGDIIFPTLSPFHKLLIKQGLPDSLIAIDSCIYTLSKEVARTKGIKFYIGGKATGEASSRYSLGFNVVEGSVKVFNGSVQLAPGVDFTVDYSSGELVIKNASALIAGSNLKITYESNDLFTLASKTMLGARMEYQLNKTSYLGFTLLNLKQQTLNDKVRIGEEPTNNTIIGFDASTEIKTNFLTNFINKLPGYNTKEGSSLSLKGEVAFMLPDPNTKKSRIPSDNGESVAYIDDFEGSKKVISLGLNPLSWTVSSIPLNAEISTSQDPDERDSLVNRRRCKMEWFNIINNVLVNEVYPNKRLGSNQNKYLTPLILKIHPHKSGMFTYISDDTLNSFGEPEKNWTGIFKFLNTTSTNLLDENIGFIEIWMQLALAPTNDSAKMIIDLGTITEKIIANRKSIHFAPNQDFDFYTEDLNNNGTLDAIEDLGIDGVPDNEEPGYSPTNTDPSRDNYFWNQGQGIYDFPGFNGTQGNANLAEGRKIDTEDLDGDAVLNPSNNYFEYEIPLNNDTTKNPYIKGVGLNGWVQCSVPLNDFKRQMNNASFSNVQYVRVWFKGITDTAVIIKIADFSLTGNQWQKPNKNDTAYSISVVNIEDNSNVYEPPVPGDILRQRDQTQVDPNALLNEQSMSLEVRNLFQGDGRFASKYFYSRPIDLLNYRIFKLFVNCDPDFKYIDTTNYDAAFVVRLGSDSSNYYEYRAPCHSDERPKTPWNALNEVTINLSDMTLVKQLRTSVDTVNYFPVPNGPPGAKYGILGNPTISSIRVISLGVVNNHGSIVTQPISGSVWFNEMRVLKTNDKSGYAFTFGAALKMADLANLNFSFSKVDPNFHSLENRFGSRTLSNNWDLSGTVNLHKIINSLLSSAVSVKFKDFFTIPVNFSHTEVYDKPTFLPGTDIDLETAVNSKLAQFADDLGIGSYYADQVRIASQTLRITNRFSINGFKFTYPSDNFFVRELVNKIEVSFYRNSVTERTPITESKYAWDMGGSIGLSSTWGFMDDLHLNIGKFIPLGEEYKNAKLYFFFPFFPLSPLYANTFSVGTSFTRSRGNEQLRNQLRPNPTSRSFNNNRNFTMDWKFIENWIIDITGNYSFGAGSDLTYLETYNDSVKTQRSEGEIFDDIFFNKSLINFGKDLSYSQTVSINPRFNIPVFKDFVDLTSSYRSQYSWQPSLQTVFTGNSVGYTADFQSSAQINIRHILDLFKSDDKEKLEGGSFSRFQQDGDRSIGELLKFFSTFVPNQVNLTYSQSKSIANSGIGGRPGFTNFWMMFNSKDHFGPSRLYQLGWTNDPGPRVPFVSLSDREGYSNTLNISTYINPIFPDNLKISFTYKTSWATNKVSNYVTDGAGGLGFPTSILSYRTVTRPAFLFFGDIKSKLKRPEISTLQGKEIAESFENDVVPFPFPGWNITLSGIEKFEMFSNFATNISFENGFSTEYKKITKYIGESEETVESQSIVSGFSPLIGLNVTFKQIEGGALTASLKISKTNNYDVTPSSQTINNTSNTDLSINASYTKSGFKIPLFGLSLDNDLSIAFSYTRTSNDPRLLRFFFEEGSWHDDALNGSISTTINPSIQYALSKSVTMQVFYKYTKIGPSEGSQQIPTRKSNEAGLNIRLTIQ